MKNWNIYTFKLITLIKQGKKNIIQTAIDLFNQKGVGSVRIRDIADTAGISPGNLTYHYKTKKELMRGVYEFMQNEFINISAGELQNVEPSDTIEWTKTYFEFQIRFRFFYRDTLEIIDSFPKAKMAYRKHIDQHINFNRKVIKILVEKGYLKPEPLKGIYDSLAINCWVILKSWVVEREIVGVETVNMSGGIRAALNLYYPYYTEKGLEFFFKAKEEITNWGRERED